MPRVSECHAAELAAFRLGQIILYSAVDPNMKYLACPGLLGLEVIPSGPGML